MSTIASALKGTFIDRMLKLATSDNQKSILLAAQLARKITPAHRQTEIGWLIDQLSEETPVLQIARHVGRDLNPRARKAFIQGFVVNGLMQSSDKRAAFTERTGAHAPLALLISPTMRCNLACEGCYAGAYSPNEDLAPEILQSIVDQANAIGVSIFTILGGEPFLRPDLLDLAARNPDSYFQVYTNGTLLTDAVIERLARLGNVAPMLSIEGGRDSTDARRGEGVYDTIMTTMDKLGRAGLAFGYSTTVMRNNFRDVTSPEFVDALVAKGAMIGWYFLYMPVGREPDMSLMPTPEERNEFREAVLKVRQTQPLFAIDFWGDSLLVGGCIAAKWYLHITSEGWVEPCVFAHFATHNIKTSTLEEAITSPLFTEIRRRQPFNHNLLMPCMLIDNPRHSREIVALTGARPTHPGAEAMFGALAPQLDDYAAEVDRLYSQVWPCISHDPRDAWDGEHPRTGAEQTRKRAAPSGAAHH